MSRAECLGNELLSLIQNDQRGMAKHCSLNSRTVDESCSRRNQPPPFPGLCFRKRITITMAFEASRDLSARPNHMPTPKSFFLLHKQLFYDEEKILKNVDKAFLQSRRRGPFFFSRPIDKRPLFWWMAFCQRLQSFVAWPWNPRIIKLSFLEKSFFFFRGFLSSHFEFVDWQDPSFFSWGRDRSRHRDVGTTPRDSSLHCVTASFVSVHLNLLVLFFFISILFSISSVYIWFISNSYFQRWRLLSKPFSFPLSFFL